MSIVRFRQAAIRPAQVSEGHCVAADGQPLAASPALFADLEVTEWRRIVLPPVAGKGGDAGEGGEELLVVVAPGPVDGLRLRARAVGSGAFALPPAVAVLEALPRTAEGSSIAEAEAVRCAARAADRWFPYEAPRSMLQRDLVCALETATGFAPIGISDDFFRLGVDSLVAIRFAMLVEPLSPAGVTLDDIFELGNVQRLAERLGDEVPRRST